MGKVTLYDIPSKAPTECWSLNPWKPRLILNYKGIDYKTEWVDYPDIAPTFKSFGIPPHDKNSPEYWADYTSPVIRFEDGTFVMDSWALAEEIEKRYPTPSLSVHDPIVQQVKAILMSKIFPALKGEILPKVPKILTEVSEGWFHEDRKKRLGVSLDAFEQAHGGDKAWEEVKAPAKEMAGLLKKNDGPFFLGKKVSWADFILVSYMEFLRRVDVGVYERFLGLEPEFGTLYDASKEWLKRAG